MSAQDPQRQAASPAAPQASAPQASSPSGPGHPSRAEQDSADEAVADLVDNLFSPAPEEPEPEDDPLAYGSDFGRMVDLGPDAEPAAPAPDFELPADLLESGQFTPVVREDTRSREVEPLELIKDPLKSPSEKISGAVSGPPSGATTAFQPLAGGSRTIEVPVSVDADLLADGKTLRLVLNLRMRR
jgi:hypothetical protein